MACGQIPVHERETRCRIGHGDTRQRTDELVASIANDQVIRAEMSPDRAGCLAQKPVAGCVTICVVGPLEVVDVDKGDCERLLLPFRSVHLAVQLEEARISAVCAGESIHREDGSLPGREDPVGRRGISVVCCLGLVAGSSSPVPQGSRPVGGGAGIDPVDAVFPCLGALVPSFGPFVARVGNPVMSFGPLVTPFRGAVPVLTGMIRRGGVIVHHGQNTVRDGVRSAAGRAVTRAEHGVWSSRAWGTGPRWSDALSAALACTSAPSAWAP